MARNRLYKQILRDTNQHRFGRIIVLTGARQTGKTTLVKKTFPDYTYISIEDPVTVDEYKNLTAAQWSSIFPKAILDEIQKEPQLVESIKAVYDQYEDPRYILLGSSQILLLKKIKESLAGRCTILELYPLIFTEMLTNSWADEVELSMFQNILLEKETLDLPFKLDPKHADKLRVYNNYLQFGGYPALSDEALSSNDKRTWLRNYVRTYLERDLRDLAEIRNLEPFTKVQKLFALRTAQLSNYSQIGNEAGVTSKTVQRFLEYLNLSYQTISLAPWNGNSKKRLVKSAKIHYLDVGVMRALTQKEGPLNGNEFETAIIAEIYKQAKAVRQDISFYHLRTSDGREIDLLIETEHGFIAIEVKQSNSVRDVDARHFKELEEILDKPILHRFVLSNDLSKKKLAHGAIGLPAVQFLT